MGLVVGAIEAPGTGLPVNATTWKDEVFAVRVWPGLLSKLVILEVLVQ